MGLLKILVTYFNPKVSLLGQTWHFSPLILRFLGGVSSDLIWFAKIVAKYDCVSRNQNQTILINLVSKYLQSISLTYVNHYNPRFVYFYPLFEIYQSRVNEKIKWWPGVYDIQYFNSGNQNKADFIISRNNIKENNFVFKIFTLSFIWI